MSYAPCKNPKCPSYGRPHPNCRCYGEMAEGGEVSFCSTSRDHQKGCQYFQDGGEAINPDEVVLDVQEPAPVPTPTPKPVPAASDEIPAAEVKIDVEPEINPNEVIVDDTSKYATPGQQALTALEGAAQGIGGPIATLAESGLSKLGVPGISAEEQAGREKENPWVHGLAETAGVAGSMLTGVGEAAIAMKGAEALAQTAKLGKVGAAVLKGALSNGIIQGVDEISKAILGQGDPENAVSPFMAIGTSAVLGGLLGGAGAKASQFAAHKLLDIAESKAIPHLESFLVGIGDAAESSGVVEGLGKFHEKGMDFYKNGLNNLLAKTAGAAVGQAVGHDAFSTVMGAEVLSKFIDPILSKITNSRLARKVGKYTVPTVMRWMAEGMHGSLLKTLDYVEKVDKGTSLINNSLDAIFKAGSQQIVNHTKPKDIEDLKSWIEAGGTNQEIQDDIYEENAAKEPVNFAEGGPVEKQRRPRDDHMARTLPDQNILLQSAKGRISNYLSSMRPQKDVPRLAFDDKPDDRMANKSYHKALEIAANPLSVMHHVSTGTIEPEQVKHLNALYPELVNHLQKKITDKIIKAQLEGKKPSYKVRQGLSMLMGTPLSGELTPSGIQAAQRVFASRGPEGQEAQRAAPLPKHGKSMSSLSKSDDAFLTGSQAREQRAQKV